MNAAEACQLSSKRLLDIIYTQIMIKANEGEFTLIINGLSLPLNIITTLQKDGYTITQDFETKKTHISWQTTQFRTTS